MKNLFKIAIASMIVSIATTTSSCHLFNKQSKSDTVIKDSLVIKESINWKDTVVFYPVDSIAIKALVKCPDGSLINMPVKEIKTSRASISIGIKNGLLISKCICDSGYIKARFAEKIKEVYKSHLNKNNTVTIVPEKYIPSWVKWLAWTGALFLLATLIYLIIKIYKIFY